MNVEFEGVEMTPVSTITAYPRKAIVETMVKAYKTVQGEVYYSCIGKCRRDNEWYPLAADTRDFETAWAVREHIEELLQDARARQDERDRRLSHLRGHWEE